MNRNTQHDINRLLADLDSLLEDSDRAAIERRMIANDWIGALEYLIELRRSQKIVTSRHAAVRIYHLAKRVNVPEVAAHAEIVLETWRVFRAIRGGLDAEPRASMREYISVNEYGLAVEDMVLFLREKKLRVDDATRERIHRLARRMHIDLKTCRRERRSS